MNNNLCQIIKYSEEGLYHPIKVYHNGHFIWEDMSGQQLRKTYKTVIRCPCREYSNEHCNGNYSKNLIYETKNHSYFIDKHIKSKYHKFMILHKNQETFNLEQKTQKELIQQIEELEREKRKDKVEFREYLEIQQKAHKKEIDELVNKIKELEEVKSCKELKYEDHTDEFNEIKKANLIKKIKIKLNRC